jgi:hypothetical protein
MFSKGPIVTLETYWTIQGKSPDVAQIAAREQTVKVHTINTNGVRPEQEFSLSAETEYSAAKNHRTFGFGHIFGFDLLSAESQ